MFPMILIVGLITYPCQSDSRGSSGSSEIVKQHEENEVTEENKAKAAKLFREAAKQRHGVAIEWLEENAKGEKGE
jgi:hypothetical protein